MHTGHMYWCWSPSHVLLRLPRVSSWDGFYGACHTVDGPTCVFVS